MELLIRNIKAKGDIKLISDLAARLGLTTTKLSLEELEDIDDIRLYKEAKKNDDGYRINLNDYIKQRKAKNG